MKELLKEIRSEMEAISPGHLKLKKIYATQKEIADFEKHSRLSFPTELKEFWLHCDFELTFSTEIYKTLHCEDGPVFFMMDELEYMVNYWNENSGHPFDKEFDSGSYFNFKGRGFLENILTPMVFDKGWFPLATDSYDGAICIDLNPGPNGKHGQLIYMMYIGDSKSGPYYSGYNSFKELLEHHLHLLKQRKIDIEEGIIYPLSPFS